MVDSHGNPVTAGIRALVLAPGLQARAGGGSSADPSRRLLSTVIVRFDEPTAWPVYRALVGEIAQGDTSAEARRVAADVRDLGPDQDWSGKSTAPR